MATITINGPTGAGGPEIGVRVAKLIGADFVDRIICAEAAKRMNATVKAVLGKEQQLGNNRDRFAHFLQMALEHSAMAGAGGEPSFGPGLELLLSKDYPEAHKAPITNSHALDDKKFIEVTTAVIKELARRGNVVMSGRGGNLILKDTAGVLHVGLVAPKDLRIQIIMEREHLDYKHAEEFVDKHEAARIAYFTKFFSTSNQNPDLYHIVLNVASLKMDTVANIIVDAAKDAEITHKKG